MIFASFAGGAKKLVRGAYKAFILHKGFAPRYAQKNSFVSLNYFLFAKDAKPPVSKKVQAQPFSRCACILYFYSVLAFCCSLSTPVAISNMEEGNARWYYPLKGSVIWEGGKKPSNITAS